MTSSGMTRRALFARSAAAAAGISLAITLQSTQRARAKVDPEPDAAKDNDTLNALLTAEYDAIATYTAGAGIIAADSATPQATRDLVTKVAVHFQAQHRDHANALKKLIEDNDGTPVAESNTPTLPGSFPASSATTTDVIKLATDKEKQAAYTYANVINSLSTQAAAKLAASIGGVETQHFVVLYLLAEGLVVTTDATGQNDAALVVPASFILDVGASGTTNLENFPAIDALLKLDEA